MKNKILLICYLLVSLNLFTQISNLTVEFDLPNALEETSGLIHFNEKIITHNDSGDDANLYEIDLNTGLVTRIIQITNAENIDWEDISQDDDFIFIADIGNNNGNRTDLKIYVISKMDVILNNSVTAEIIHFSYEDQVDFSDNSQTNFDAEAMVVYNDDILIFTKNRGDFKTNAYKFPKFQGTYVVEKIGTYDVQGLITGATFNYADFSLFLSGYTFAGDLRPFLVYLSDFENFAIFDGTVVKTDITSIIGLGSQLEAIANSGDEHYYLSREERNGLPQRLYSFVSQYVLDINDISEIELVVYPNPFVNEIKLISDTEIIKIEIFDGNGKLILSKITNLSTIKISDFAKGSYQIKIYTSENIIVKKLIKI